MQTSITSIIGTLRIATVSSGLLGLTFFLVGLTEVAVAFLLATTIGLGLFVISIVWRALTDAHPSDHAPRRDAQDAGS